MRIFICGDSTAASYAPERAPIVGWGQLLGSHVPGAEIINRAMAGRSTKSYLAEGRLQAIEKELQAGDLLLIQFTHNDGSDLVWRHTDPYTSFTDNLAIFVDTARLRGAIPVLMTPIPRRSWQNGELVDLHGDYPKAIRRLAMLRNVPLLEILEMGMAHLRQLGDEESRKLYMHVEPGVYPDYPNGNVDDTHTRHAGADLYARLAAEALRQQKLI
jgi:lysophospholipase L1-like esterase